MLGLNTITLISSRVGSFIKRIVTDGLKMRLPFTSAKPLGENLVVNGGFEDSSNWVSLGTAELPPESDVGTARIYTTSNYAGIYQSNSNWAFEKYYIVTITVSEYNSGQIFLLFDGGSAGGQAVPQAVGTYNLKIFNTTGSAAFYISRLGGGTTDITISNVSVEEHAQETPDTSNNGNNAILKTGKCLDFDGANDGIDISNFSMSGSEGTFAFWCKPDTTAGTKYIIDLAENNDGRFVIAHSTIFRVFTQTGGGGGAWTNSPTAVVADEWQRIVVTIDSSKNLKFYKNGVQLGSTQTANANLNIDAVTAAWIGRLHSSVSSPVNYNGSLSDFQIYNKVWSSDDVAYDYANPQNLVTDNLSSDIHLRNLKAWWHLSEGSGSVIHDSAPLIGGELVVNGDFSTDSDFGTYLELSDWNTYDNENTSSSGWGISSGALSYDGNGSQYNKVFQVLNTVIGRTYKMTFTLSGLSNSGVNFGFGSSGGSFINPQATYNSSGTYTRYMVADRTDHSIVIQNNSATQSFSIDNVSVKEVFNVDGEAKDGSALGASWEDGQERIPQLGLMNWSKGSNLIEYSEDISEWNGLAGAVVSFDSDIVNPDGTVGCYKVTFDGTFNGRVERAVGIDGTNVQSVYLRVASGTQVAKIGGASTSLGDVTVTDEWQRFSHSGTYIASYTNPRVRCDDAAVIYVWGVQYEYGTTASAYRKTNGLPVTNSTLIKTPDVEQFTGNKVDRNLIRYSEDLNHPLGDNGWNRHDCTAEYGYEDPFGSNRASKITSADLDGNFNNDPWIISEHTSNSSNREYTSSVWVKGTSSTVGDTVRLWVVSGNDYLGENFTITEDWQRISTTKTFPQSVEGQVVYFRVDPPEISTLGDEVFVFGPQLQEGGLTRYFPTYGAIAQETLPIIGKDVLGNDIESRGGALNLDGIGYLEVLDDNVFDIPTNEAFSICGWAKWGYVPQGVPGVFVSSLNTIYSNGNHLGNNSTFSVSAKRVSGTNKVSAFINTSEILSSITYNEGDWFYFALTRRAGGGNNTGKLYLSKIEQGDWVVVQDGNTISNNSAITNSDSKTIGWDGTVGDRKYHELIDDIKFYDRELSLDEIKQNFNATKSAHTN